MSRLKSAIFITLSVVSYGCTQGGASKPVEAQNEVVYHYGCVKNYRCAPSNNLAEPIMPEGVATAAPKNRQVDTSAAHQAISAAIYGNDYQAFSRAYLEIKNKDSIVFTQGHYRGEAIGYLGLSMYLPDPRFFNLVVEYADPNAANYSGLTALFLAPDLCALDKAKKLLAKGANVNYVSQGTGATPLHMVVGTSCYQLATLLLAHGADKQAKTKHGQTPYDLARKSGNARMAQLLKFN